MNALTPSQSLVPSTHSHTRRTGKRWAGAAFLSIALVAASATQAVHAQGALVGEAYKKVNQLISAKNYNAAQKAADEHIQNNPHDPQMRLLKSRILVAQGKQTQAIQLLEALTQEFPEIAEPYNNLAVLYASQGQLDQAHVALENALRINPNYTTALQNMGDVYKRKAHEHYQKALSLQPNNRALQEKVRSVQ